MTVPLVTQKWRQQKLDEQRAYEAGEITADECYMEQLFPDEFIDRTEPVLKKFAAEIEVLAKQNTDNLDAVLDATKNLVLALNQINVDFDHAVIETDEREQLCQYIDDVIDSSGIGVKRLAEHMNCDRHEITDEWREW